METLSVGVSVSVLAVMYKLSNKVVREGVISVYVVHGLYISNNENLCLPSLMATHMVIGLLAITGQIACQ